MAIKIKKKKSKVEEEEANPLLEQDQFLQTSDKSIGWMAQNRQVVIVGAIVVIAAVAGLGFLKFYLEQSSEVRASVLNEAVEVLETPVENEASKPPPKPGAAPAADEGPKFPSAEAKFTEMQIKADAVLSAYPNDNIAGPARLIKARAAHGLGKYDEAITLYQEWLDANPSASERPIVLQAISTAQGASGKTDAAVGSLESLVKLDKETYGEMATYQIARIYDTAGNKEKAKQRYDSFIKDYPDSSKVELAKLRRETL